jgi:maleate cis-trans isomerase
MKKVTKEELAAMDAMSLKCAQELSDAHVDVTGYACLVAIMSMGCGYHCVSEINLYQETIANNETGIVKAFEAGNNHLIEEQQSGWNSIL